MQTVTMPQVIMILAIQRRAPTFWSARLLGTSTKKYEMKKSDAAKPNIAGVSPRVLVHLERGEADVHALEQRKEVADHQEGNEPQDHPAHGRLLEIVHSRHLVCHGWSPSEYY